MTKYRVQEINGFVEFAEEAEALAYATMVGGIVSSVEEAPETQSLEDVQADKIKSIDTKTVSLIGQGFTFDGKQFSLSQAAQLNWLGLKSLEALITWPIAVTTKGDGEYSLAQGNLNYFIGTGKAVVQAHLDSGRALKLQVNAATTVEQVNAVIDSR
jgi:hypothetical protein